MKKLLIVVAVALSGSMAFAHCHHRHGGGLFGIAADIIHLAGDTVGVLAGGAYYQPCSVIEEQRTVVVPAQSPAVSVSVTQGQTVSSTVPVSTQVVGTQPSTVSTSTATTVSTPSQTTVTVTPSTVSVPIHTTEYHYRPFGRPYTRHIHHYYPMHSYHSHVHYCH